MAISDLEKLWEGWSEDDSEGRQSVTELYKCPYADRRTSVTELLSSVHSDYSNLRAMSTSVHISGEPDPTSGGPLNVLITTKYEDPTSSSSSKEDRPVDSDWNNWEERWESAAEAVTLKTGYKWTTDNVDIGKDGTANAVKLFPTVVLTITGRIRNFTSTPKGAVLAAVGKINTDAVSIKGFSYDAEKLLFAGLDATEGVSDTYTLTYKFQYRPLNTWNQFWRDSKAGTDPAFELIEDEGGDGPYQKIAFSTIDPSNW